jgi:hypothetical protein
MIAHQYLSKAGLTNEYSTDLAGIMGNGCSIEFRAYCSSRACAGTLPRKVIKYNANHGAENCPDCGHSLFWKRFTKRGVSDVSREGVAKSPSNAQPNRGPDRQADLESMSLS